MKIKELNAVANGPALVRCPLLQPDWRIEHVNKNINYDTELSSMYDCTFNMLECFIGCCMHMHYVSAPSLLSDSSSYHISCCDDDISSSSEEV